MIALGLAIACGSREVPRAIQASTSVPAPPVPAPELPVPVDPVVAPGPVPAVIAPHGRPIIRVAIADGGDAVLSLDDAGALRLWPALDGTREPIVVRAVAPRLLATARHDGELVAAISDAAGGAEVQRFDAAGARVGRAKLPAEPAIEQLAIVSGIVLARRADQTIDAYDVRGDVRGRLIADAGQRVASIVTRGTAAAAAIADAPGPKVRALRRIVLDGAVAWGPTIALPGPLSDLALSPSGDVIAGIAGKRVQIVELAPRPKQLASLAVPPTKTPDAPVVGFVADDVAVLAVRDGATTIRRTGTRWTAERPRHLNRSMFEVPSPAVFGDGLAVTSQGTGLALIASTVRHLGYRDVGAGGLQATGLTVRLSYPDRLIWLDDQLRALRISEASDAPGVVIDDHHLAVSRASRIVIRDVVAGTETEVVKTRARGLVYDRGTRVLAVHDRDRVLRYRISLAPFSVTQLRSIVDLKSIVYLFLTDPALAGGAVAVAIVGGRTAYTYTAPDETGGAALEQRSRYESHEWIRHVDRAGRVYASESRKVEIRRDGQLIWAHPDMSSNGIAETEDARTVALVLAGELTVLDLEPRVAVRWHLSVPTPIDVAWTSGDRLLVSTKGGLMSFDAASQERVALSCGWRFGLHDQAHAVISNELDKACAVE